MEVELGEWSPVEFNDLEEPPPSAYHLLQGLRGSNDQPLLGNASPVHGMDDAETRFFTRVYC